MNEIDQLTRIWTRLTTTLDFHAKKWYLFDEDEGDWQQLNRNRVNDVLLDLEIPEEEHERIIQQFILRDHESHSRDYEDMKRAQLRFGF